MIEIAMIGTGEVARLTHCHNGVFIQTAEDREKDKYMYRKTSYEELVKYSPIENKHYRYFKFHLLESLKGVA